MGKRVTVAITNPTIGEEDVIFWCNATSFSPIEVVENLACGSKTLDELIAKLKDYSSYSNIASRDERFFGEEISYPFLSDYLSTFYLLISLQSILFRVDL